MKYVRHNFFRPIVLLLILFFSCFCFGQNICNEYDGCYEGNVCLEQDGCYEVIDTDNEEYDLKNNKIEEQQSIIHELEEENTKLLYCIIYGICY